MKPQTEPGIPPLGKKKVAGITYAAQPIEHAKENAHAFKGESFFSKIGSVLSNALILSYGIVYSYHHSVRMIMLFSIH